MTTVLPAPAAAPASTPPSRLATVRAGTAATLALTRRNLLHWLRQPQLLLLSTVQPVVVVVVFTSIFRGTVGGAVDPVAFLLPGILVQVLAFDSLQTAVGLAEDLSDTTVDRLRTLPVPRSAVLVARTLADVCRNVAVVLLMLAAGSALGFRYPGGPLRTIAGVAIVLAFAYALSWIFTAIALSVPGGAEAANAAGVVWMFPLVFASTALAPAGAMPGWLRGFVAHQPVSAVVDAVRALLLGQPAGGAVLMALGWTGAIVAVFGPISVRRFQRLA
jgi:ABC-2 type transport system permease protein/oleandomycin transport system permease protein